VKTGELLFHLLDPWQPVSTNLTRSHLQGDECVGSCQDAVHSTSTGLRLARPSKHRSSSFRRHQDQETVRKSAVRSWLIVLLYISKSAF